MESVSNVNQIENLEQNTFVGKPEFVNSSVTLEVKVIYFFVKGMLS